mgnify:CR=1 FL=1
MYKKLHPIFTKFETICNLHNGDVCKIRVKHKLSFEGPYLLEDSILGLQVYVNCISIMPEIGGYVATVVKPLEINTSHLTYDEVRIASDTKMIRIVDEGWQAGYGYVPADWIMNLRAKQ